MNQAQKLIKDYIRSGYVFFTLKKIELDEKNKKQLVGMPNWKLIDNSNYLENVNEKHKALAIITGKMSKITVMDFDVKNNECSYEQVIQDFPEVKHSYTVKTQSYIFYI
jgi:phage FluMu gp28-like protein